MNSDDKIVELWLLRETVRSAVLTQLGERQVENYHAAGRTPSSVQNGLLIRTDEGVHPANKYRSAAFTQLLLELSSTRMPP